MTTKEEQLTRIYKAIPTSNDDKKIHLIDVMHYIDDNLHHINMWKEAVYKMWDNMSFHPTIEKQSPECIQYISDLIPNN